MDGYRLLTYQKARQPTVGVLVENTVFPASQLLARSAVDCSSVMALLQNWPRADRLLHRAVRAIDPHDGAPLGRVRLLAPLLYPRAIFCAGANYWDHMEEMEKTIDRSKRAKEPWFFLKTSAQSIVGPGAKIAIPAKSKQLDWEAELAVVIGRRAHNVAAERAPRVIAGYTILNDLSARDLTTRSDRPPAMTFDWVGQKCFEGSAPMGPWLTPARAIPDCHDLSVRLWVNDQLKQDSNTSQLIHNIYEQIEWLSHQLPLLPGDVIGTGTPAGVGAPRGEFLRSGDVVRIEIEGCGELTNAIA